MLLPADDVSYEEHEKEVRRKAKILEKTFQDFGFNVKVVEIETGPVIAQYEVELEAGLRLSRITGLADDLAIALRVPSVRIVAPIPGKNTVGIEVPNEQRQLVRLREVIEETNGRAKRMKIPIFLGKDVSGNPLVVDLATLPHLLIAGRTGTGKSVCLNSIIVSILMARGPDEVRMLMIDPKMVELSGYRKLPHLMHPVVTDMRKAEAILAWGVDKMEERYALLARAGVRHISVYNQLSEEELRSRVQPETEEEWQQIPRQLPFIVIVADEIADLMMTAGKDVSGNPLVVDLSTLPHLLIAGRTGTGKSVCLNAIISSILMTRRPDEVRMLMIDPKMVELSGYARLPHLMHPVVTDMKKAEAILAWAVDKMEERYQLLARAGVRHISVFNQLSDEELRGRIDPTSEAEWETIPKQLPFIVIVADELADLMMTAGKDVEQHIIRLAQKSRAVGIHLILATQKPTVDVITGLIKSNLPARIAFQVASRTDSRVVLDEMGADKLLGNGDMLFLSPGTSQLLRGQGTYLSDDEITRVVDFVGTDVPQFAKELIELKAKDEGEDTGPGELKNRDELYEAAVDIVVRERRGSVSLLQRCLGIGYGRAARLIDFMAEDGIVGEYNGSQAREVAISIEEWEAMQTGGATPGEATTPPKSKRINKVLPGSDEPSDIEEELIAEDPSNLEYEVDDEDDDSEYEEESEFAPGEPSSAGGECETDDEYEYEEESDDEIDEEDKDLWEDDSDDSEDDKLANTA